MLKRSTGNRGWRLAAPSWVLPGTIWENCCFLEGKVDEVALLFFETESCLAYGRKDLPLELRELQLGYHVHLPLDLPWVHGGKVVARCCLRLMDSVSFLDARRCVLHPPPASMQEGVEGLLQDFALEWTDAGRETQDVFLENTRENDLSALLPFLPTLGFDLCPDLGHMLAYGQKITAELADMGYSPGMLHLNAPGRGEKRGQGKSAHLPLHCLSPAEQTQAERLCARLAQGGTVVAEFFVWEYVVSSLPLIRSWMKRCDHGLFP